MTPVRRWAPLAVFTLIASILILPPLFSGLMVHGHDVTTVFHYQRTVIAQAFREGRLPVWDPHVMAGFPLLAGLQGAVFYPPTWFCVFLSAGTFWTLSVWSHAILAGVFAHRWLQRGLRVGDGAALTGALLFMISGYFVARVLAGHVNYVWAYPWVMALLWRLDRFLDGPTWKRGALLSGALALIFLAGHPQFVFFAGLLSAGRLTYFVLARREERKARATTAGIAVGCLALGLLFCAPQLFPSLELLGQAQRGDTYDEYFLSYFALKPSELIYLVFGDTRSFSVDYHWESAGYIGGAAFLLLLAAMAGKHPQRHLWLGVAIFSLVIAMGPHVPFYTGFVKAVPGAGLFRGPARYLLLFTVGASALAGFGFESLWKRERPWFRFPAIVLTLAMTSQLMISANKILTREDPRLLQWSKQEVDAVRARLGLEQRVATARPIDIGFSQAAGLDNIGGYEPLMLRRYAELMNAAEGAPIGRTIVVMCSVGSHPVVDMLGVSVWYNKWKNVAWSENPDALPRAWVVNNAVVIESKEERLRILGKGPWDPRKTVILEEYPEDAPPVPTETPAGRAKVVSRAGGEYVLDAENAADAYLVLSEAWYPGWRAEIDGKPAEVLPANHLIQAIRLPAGKHVVRFSYRSRFLGLGFGVAFLAAMVPVAIVLVRRRRR